MYRSAKLVTRAALATAPSTSEPEPANHVQRLQSVANTEHRLVCKESIVLSAYRDHLSPTVELEPERRRGAQQPVNLGPQMLELDIGTPKPAPSKVSCVGVHLDATPEEQVKGWDAVLRGLALVMLSTL